MKRFLSYFLLVVAALAILVYVASTFFLGSIVKAGVNRIGPKLTQTNVVLESATLSPLSGSGTLTGLAVDNPAGWTAGRAFYLGRVHVSLQPLSLFSDHIVINEIEIDQPEFLYETKIFSSNIGDLLAAIEKSVGSDHAETETAGTGHRPVKLEVRHFQMTRGKVTVGVGAKAVELPMPPIELKDLGTKEGGVTPNQLAAAVMKSVTGSVVSATAQASGQIGSTLGAAVIDKAKKASDEVKKIFSGDK